MSAALHERLLAELRAVATQLPVGSGISLGQSDDVILLLQPLRFDGNHAEALTEIINQLGEKNFFTGVKRLGQQGIAATLVPHALANGFGFHLDLSENEGANLLEALFSEPATGNRAVVTTRPKAHLPLSNFVDRRGVFTAEAIGRWTRGDLRVRWMGETVLELASCAPILRRQEKCPARTGH